VIFELIVLNFNKIITPVLQIRNNHSCSSGHDKKNQICCEDNTWTRADAHLPSQHPSLVIVTFSLQVDNFSPCIWHRPHADCSIYRWAHCMLSRQRQFPTWKDFRLSHVVFKQTDELSWWKCEKVNNWQLTGLLAVSASVPIVNVVSPNWTR
jgi:hypothetical protein